MTGELIWKVTSASAGIQACGPPAARRRRAYAAAGDCAHGCSGAAAGGSTDDGPEERAAHRVADGTPGLAGAFDAELVRLQRIGASIDVERGDGEREFRTTGELTGVLALSDHAVHSCAAGDREIAVYGHVPNDREVDRLTVDRVLFVD